MKTTKNESLAVSLKGQCHEIFDFWFFSWISFPKHLSIPLRPFRFFRKFAEIFAAQGAPPVSTTPVANCHRYQRHRWQTMGLISGCRYLKVNLKAKMYICVTSTIQRCPNKIIKIFLLESFCHLPPVSLTPVANRELRISPRIFEKIRNGPNGILRGWGETDSWKKKPEAKNLRTLSLCRACLHFSSSTTNLWESYGSHVY